MKPDRTPYFIYTEITARTHQIYYEKQVLEGKITPERFRQIIKTIGCNGHTYDIQELTLMETMPVVCILCANVYVLCNMLRIIIGKLQSANKSKLKHYCKTVKAFFILMPLLGLTDLVFFYNSWHGTISFIILRIYPRNVL